MKYRSVPQITKRAACVVKMVTMLSLFALVSCICMCFLSCSVFGCQGHRRIHSVLISEGSLLQPQFIIQTDKMRVFYIQILLSYCIKQESIFMHCFWKTTSGNSYISCSISLPLVLFLAPDRAPLNIQWTMIGSTLTLHWDPVVAMETESKVTGYLVGLNSLQSSDLSPESKMTVFASAHFSASPSPASGAAEETSLQWRQHHFDEQNHCGAQPLCQWQLSHSDQGHEWGWRRCGQWTHPHP